MASSRMAGPDRVAGRIDQVIRREFVEYNIANRIEASNTMFGPKRHCHPHVVSSLHWSAASACSTSMGQRANVRSRPSLN